MVTELTDEQVLEQLKARKVRLKMELERVEVAIKAFEKITDFDALDALPYLVEYINDDEELAMATLMYSPRMTAENKILYVLAKIGKGDATEITDYLLRIDKVRDVKKLYSRIAYVASRMYNLAKITAVRDGKRNVYKLKT